MTIYHLSTNVHSRGKGHSAVRASAYRSGEILHDERLGETYDFTQYRKSHGETLVSQIFLPEGTDTKYLDRATLWNGAEDAERTKAGAYKKTSVISRDIECALPAEMTDTERAHFSKEHAKYLVLRYGCAVDMNIHAPHPDGSQKNYHVHYLLTTRKLDKDGFGTQCELELNGKVKKKLGLETGKNQLKEMRENWANHLNKALERGGHSDRVDHRSYEDQGIDKTPTIHMGVEATEMERRSEDSRLGDKNREIESVNQNLSKLKDERKVIDLAIEREKRLQKQKTSPAITKPPESSQQRQNARYKLGLRHREELYQFESKSADQKTREEETLNDYYKPHEHTRKLQEAQRNLDKHQGMFFRMTGKTKALEQDVADLRRNLESMETSYKQSMSMFTSKVSQARQTLTDRHKSDLAEFDRQPLQKAGTAKTFEKAVLTKEVANQNREVTGQTKEREEKAEPKQERKWNKVRVRTRDRGR